MERAYPQPGKHKKTKPEKLTALYRAHDPARGSFDPTPREPQRDHATNPQGVRHPDKTAQDRQPKDHRERYKAAARRTSLMGRSAT